MATLDLVVMAKSPSSIWFCVGGSSLPACCVLLGIKIPSQGCDSQGPIDLAGAVIRVGWCDALPL